MFVPFASLNLAQLPLQSRILELVFPDRGHDRRAPGAVEPLGQARDQMGMLGGLLHGGQRAGTGRLSFARASDFPIAGVAVRCAFLALALGLLLQQQQVHIPQRIGTEPAALEALVGRDAGRLLQRVRDAAEHGRLGAIELEAAEQQKGLEVGVGGEASIHPPVPLDGVGRTRAARRGKGSQHDGGRAGCDSFWASACRASPAEMARTRT